MISISNMPIVHEALQMPDNDVYVWDQVGLKLFSCLLGGIVMTQPLWGEALFEGDRSWHLVLPSVLSQPGNAPFVVVFKSDELKPCKLDSLGHK